jgi:predicted protein tyrosine phosphatase
MKEMKKPNLLFICSRNQWRSPTAEQVYRKKGFSARSAGTSPNAKKTISVTDIKWADVIFVMEKKHKNRIVAKFGRLVEFKPIYILDIQDDYQYMDVELISCVEDNVEQYLQQSP